ncbi:AmmeMemoRadiSam system protein B [Lichtheimia ornata]|uniref:AmmeMemoRadiSam system protein B n=1 Tax=Lichtheimia ornata TaxID=688661 RepID=A0AAD7Y068_9FUNG|nr:AmmeMemoRadiSam system protein B [Lichtheimia ornata]KAJ8661085.1 AmmeMemoRadiSam system protein B [Lichtheimia ornata]
MKRIATHAGTWYSNSQQRLHQQLDRFLAAVPEQTTHGETFPVAGTRAIIAPHAGYSYSGPTAAYAYKCVDVTNIKRVFILGPSHHVYLESCALSQCDSYETPLGDLVLDKEVIQELAGTGHFSQMSKSVDEDEHSIEMHLPYTAKIFEGKLDQIKIVPIMVGSINERKERLYGELLAKYLVDPQTLFIVSSDFCHWGLRFSYTEYRPEPRAPLTSLRSLRNASTASDMPIYKSISDLDHEGMEKIETLDHAAFCQYLRDTNNTICGRHPIGVLMSALETIDKERRIRFIKYAQSNECQDVRDSSVSYASAYTYIAL